MLETMVGVAVGGFALLLVAGVAAGLALRAGIVATLLGAYVVMSAEVVLGAELLSPFHAIHRPEYLAWEAVVAAAAVALWLRVGRPIHRLPHVNLASLRRHPTLVVLGIAVGTALLFELFLAIAVPPNNWDALAYHLSRAAAWYQHGSIGFFASHTVRENTFPGNAEVEILFGMVFTHGDRLSALPQFVAELALLLGIFGVARRLGFGRPDAAFAALLFATLSEVVLEATTAQNDLVLAAPLLACAFFLFGRSRGEQLLAAVALGVALGTKFTAVYALPLLALLALSVLPRRRVLEFAAAAAAALALFGSAVYVQNVIHYGTPLGSSADSAAFTPKVTAANTVSTTARTLYRFADLSGFAGGFQTYKAQEAVGKFVFARLDIDPRPASATLSHQQFLFSFNTEADEDVSYFGPLGLILLLPLAFGYLGAFVWRRTSRVKAIFALALPAVAMEVALTYRYDDWLGRFMILPVAFGAALVARAYSQRLLSALVAVVGIVFLFFALAHNDRKPIGLDGSKAAWSLPREAAEGLVGSDAAQTFQAFDAIVPANATVGVVFGDDDWDYPLYGPHLTRHLVVLPAKDPFRLARTLHLDWVVVGSVEVSAAHRWQEAQVGQWRLLAPAGTPAANRLAAYATASGAV